MNKSDLVKVLSKELELTVRKSEDIVDMIFDTMSKALVNGERIEIRGFGSLLVKHYEGYNGRNPKTGESIAVEPKKLPFFKAGKDLKDQLRNS